ncbi:MAG: hypothetical protein L6R40_002013 [Gallowayella cf. fulva]|nr:MAG: hypothetical protein L6R40_002013 [Xanthomendoza cf. fulva]
MKNSTTINLLLPVLLIFSNFWNAADTASVPIPAIPKRPDAVGPNSFHVSQFVFFDNIGFVDGSPGVEAAPVFLFARADWRQHPCYPESAVVIGSNPPRKNPGSGKVRGPNPGAGCTDPGPYKGKLTPGHPFPVYVSAVYCELLRVWKLRYDTYYAHSGSSSESHTHDWEGVTIVFAPHPAAEHGEWWYRAVGESEFSFSPASRPIPVDILACCLAEYNQNGNPVWHYYHELQTVDLDVGQGPSDIHSTATDTKKKHPKFVISPKSSRANYLADEQFPNHPLHAIGVDKDYRSDDWWRLPKKEDLRSWREIQPNWDYGIDSNGHTPPANVKKACIWAYSGTLVLVSAP